MFYQGVRPHLSRGNIPEGYLDKEGLDRIEGASHKLEPSVQSVVKGQ
jgi:hypothetical protein